MGRPSSYTKEMADEICSQIAEGKSLRELCEQEGMPSKSSIFKWLRTEEGFADNYTRAKEQQAEHFADELVAIADDGSNDWMEVHHGDDEDSAWRLNGEHVQRSKLRIDSRKWLMSKMLPKKYGDKLDLNMAGSLNVTNLSDEELAAKLAAHGVSLDASRTA